MCKADLTILIPMGIQEPDKISILFQCGEQKAIWDWWDMTGLRLVWILPPLDHETPVREVPDAGTYMWQQGASVIAEALATGKEPLINAEHALHVLEIIEAARKSGSDGKRVKLQSTFKWPNV